MVAFPLGKGGGSEVGYGYKGKGVTIHSIVDRNGMPLTVKVTSSNKSERDQVLPMLDQLRVRTCKVGRPRFRPKQLSADKGYDSRALRLSLRKRNIRPEIPKRIWRGRKQRPGARLKKRIQRFVVERTFAWYQRKYRRLVARWERLAEYFNSLVYIGFIMIWVDRLILG